MQAGDGRIRNTHSRVQILKSESESIQPYLDIHPLGNQARCTSSREKGVVVTEDFEEASAFIRESIWADGFVLLKNSPRGGSFYVVIWRIRIHLPTRKSRSQESGDGDTGPNTGGMGAYAPAPL
ncbi:MAG: hypothetical protein Ct9H90mP23_2040 [Methanobacteriota archaeon]|nr:MAG: hypothetical protein Ct9H90mP23_2040 [Euryarchaeota archaeon]